MVYVLHLLCAQQATDNPEREHQSPTSNPGLHCPVTLLIGKADLDPWHQHLHQTGLPRTLTLPQPPTWPVCSDLASSAGTLSPWQHSKPARLFPDSGFCNPALTTTLVASSSLCAWGGVGGKSTFSVLFTLPQHPVLPRGQHSALSVTRPSMKKPGLR